MPTLDVNNVSNLVHLEIGGEVLHPRLLEATREHVSRAATVSSWVSHSDFCKGEENGQLAIQRWRNHVNPGSSTTHQDSANPGITLLLFRSNPV